MGGGRIVIWTIYQPISVRDSETFGAEQGWGRRVVDWLNGQSTGKLEARLYGEAVSTINFGKFEMLSWMGEVQTARRLITRASKRFKIMVIEGGYKPKERTFRMGKSDYAMVRRGDRIIGRLHFEAPLVGGFWKLVAEERA